MLLYLVQKGMAGGKDIKGKEESELKENLILFCSPYILGFRFKGK